jgi:hypothetical protein
MPVVFSGYNQIPYLYVPPGGFSVEYLIVAGGGGGGNAIGAANRNGGGGGGGGILAGSTILITGESYTVSVGTGGLGSVGTGDPVFDDVNLRRGANSTFGTITALGGGGGGAGGAGAGGSGGSGGGAGRNNTTAFGVGTSGQGNDGGVGQSGTAVTNGGGGGGGAGTPGSNGGVNTGGNGGAGASSSISGSTVFYSGGGGGAVSGTPGTGGNGGGGAGGSLANGTNGTVNTGGGGGGGGGATNAIGGNGGSGVVILKYPDTFIINVSSNLVSSETSSGGFKIRTITANTGTVSWTALPLALRYVGAAEDLTNLTTYTFIGQSIGPAAFGRNVVIVVSMSGISTGTISDLTVDGVSATLLQESKATVSGANESHHRVYFVQDNSKTTATIGVTATSGKGRCYISVYNLFGAANLNPVITANNLWGSTVDSIFQSLNVAANDAILAYATADARTFTWTGATENNESTSEAGSPVVSHANTTIAAAAASYNIGVTYSSSSPNPGLYTLRWSNS